MRDVFVEQVAAGELGLHRDELGHRIAHERDEEQPGVKMAEAVRPVGEVVTAAQDFDTAQMFLRRQLDVGVRIDQRLALVGDGVEVQRRELVLVGERRTGPPCAGR